MTDSIEKIEEVETIDTTQYSQCIPILVCDKCKTYKAKYTCMDCKGVVCLKCSSERHRNKHVMRLCNNCENDREEISKKNRIESDKACNYMITCGCLWYPCFVDNEWITKMINEWINELESRW